MRPRSHGFALKSFAFLRSALLCLRGSRTKGRTLNLQENDLSVDRDYNGCHNVIKLNQIQPAKTNLLTRKDRSVLWQHEHLELLHNRQDQYLTHLAFFFHSGALSSKKLNLKT